MCIVGVCTCGIVGVASHVWLWGVGLRRGARAWQAGGATPLYIASRDGLWSNLVSVGICVWLCDGGRGHGMGGVLVLGLCLCG
jgi:hypothetical protein